MRSFGKKPCTVGWNLKPRIPCSAMSRRASRTPISPLWGSMLANGIMTSGFSAAACATSSLGTRRRPMADSASTGNITKPTRRSL